MHADDDKDDNTRNDSKKFLMSSLTLHMKGLNISEVSKSYKPPNIWGNKYEATERDLINIYKKPCKSYRITCKKYQKRWFMTETF